MRPRLLQLVGAVAGTVAALSAAAAAWRCYRGRHPRTGRRLEFCPRCGGATDRSRWHGFVGRSFKAAARSGAVH